MADVPKTEAAMKQAILGVMEESKGMPISGQVACVKLAWPKTVAAKVDEVLDQLSKSNEHILKMGNHFVFRQ